MASCPQATRCVFYTSVQPSVVKRIKFASAFPYCNGSIFAQCALYERIDTGRPVEPNLLPTGGFGDYLESEALGANGERYVVVDDSPIFATMVSNSLRTYAPRAYVVECRSYDDASTAIASGPVTLVVSGNGIGSGKTAQDIRRITTAPMIVLSGRPENEVELPSNARFISKGAGPAAITSAIDGLLGR